MKTQETNINEYNEGEQVSIGTSHGVEVIIALNEGGHNFVQIDLRETLAWVKKNLPKIWNSI